MKNANVIDAAKKFVLTLKKTDKVAVLHHTDADGVCSGVLAAKAVEFARGKKAEMTFCQRDGDTSVTEETVDALRKRGIKKVIITDLAVDATPATIKSIEKFADVLIIDHHIKIHELSSRKTTLIKAEDISKIEPARYPASKMAYDLFSGILGEKEAWIAGVGIIGDYAEGVWKEFIKGIEKDGTGESDMRAVEELIGYARAVKHEGGVADAFRIIYGSTSAKDALKSELEKYRNAIEEELRLHKNIHKNKALFSGDMVLYEVESKYNVKSRLANILSREMYPDRTVVLLQVGKRRVDISARRQDMKKSMAELVRSVVSGMPDSLGGGHVPAAGGYFPREFLEEAKKRLIAASGKA